MNVQQWTQFPKLYGVSSTGAVKEWEIGVIEEDGVAVIVTTHGQLNGKKQVAKEKVREGKNLGRSNETTPYEQAVMDAESKWKKKKDANYSEAVPSVDAGMPKIAPNMLPMLALKLADRKHDLVWPVFAQAKFNGVRCLIKRKGDLITFTSRKGKAYKNFNYMIPELVELMLDGEVFDGEMYNHGEISFQKLCSLVKEEKNPDFEALKRYVKFYNYDYVSDKGFKERKKHLFADGKYVRKVDSYLLEYEKDIYTLHNQVVAEGYEGVMVRSGGDEGYKFQYRSPALLKYKEFQDEEYKIVGGREGVGKDEGQCIFKCQMENGKTFDVKCKGPNEVRQEQFKNLKSYIGKMLSVRFQSFTDDGIPLFPVGIVVRDYE
jgi:DNA ligase-1